MNFFGTVKRNRSKDQLSQIDPRVKHIEQDLTPIESLISKTEHILSIEPALNEMGKETKRPIKLKFYEDKTPIIKELEKIKEEVETEFENINSSYQNNQEFIKLLQANSEAMNAYLKYTEVYTNFSNRLRETIENLVFESFSPYVYQSSKILYSIYTQNDQAELAAYDIEKSQQTKINIDLYEKLTNDEISVVQLPNNELFCR
ncbi:unnamed protein product [Blepharisma stoltei]|uniref:Uncharacterized protein n=1 Tax=Blepharisma stoltei TaxID=1481888 RepID=A0AAU9IET1_9CILI|nr:unnamed protein product [Blepharisma stoltei]